MKKQLFAVILAVYMGFGILGVNAALAWHEPDFPSCSNPQGNVIASYNSGVHAIAGSTDTFTGSDTVYDQGNGNAMQCFCPDVPTTDEGIQTNWWNIAGMSNTEIQSYENQGWMFIDNGQYAGLANAPYLAKNSTYVCVCTSPTVTPTITMTETPTPTASVSATETPAATETPEVNAVAETATPTPAPSSNSNSSNSTPVQEVNSLAFTGGAETGIVLAIFGLGAIATGFILRKKVVSK